MTKGHKKVVKWFNLLKMYEFTLRSAFYFPHLLEPRYGSCHTFPYPIDASGWKCFSENCLWEMCQFPHDAPWFGAYPCAVALSSILSFGHQAASTFYRRPGYLVPLHPLLWETSDHAPFVTLQIRDISAGLTDCLTHCRRMSSMSLTVREMTWWWL